MLESMTLDAAHKKTELSTIILQDTRIPTYLRLWLQIINPSQITHKTFTINGNLYGQCAMIDIYANPIEIFVVLHANIKLNNCK